MIATGMLSVVHPPGLRAAGGCATIVGWLTHAPNPHLEIAMTRLCRLVPVVLLVVASLAHGAEVENPEYAVWKAFKAGASSTLRMRATFPGQEPQEVTMATQLRSVDEQAAVVARALTVTMEGQTHTMPGGEDAIAATIDAEELDPLYASITNEDVERGEEKITVNGKAFACTWYAVDGEDEQVHVKGKIWICPDVPGGIVRFEGNHNSEQGEGTMTMELIDYALGE